MASALAKLASKRVLRVAGLMSGTSADGVDAAIVDVSRRGLPTCAKQAGVAVVAFETYPYRPAVRRAVLDLSAGAGAPADVARLNVLLGEVFADAVIRLARRRRIGVGSIDLIGSHGQTIHHEPGGGRIAGRRVRSTLQIGEPAVIAERTGVTTVADFRPRDLAAGGEGAPLVAYADWILFAHRRIGRAVQNIGGIANVTFLPPGGRIEDVLAFDTGPGNMVIDAAVVRATGGRKAFDRDGRIAASGRVHEALLADLMRHRFCRRRPPKSAGREQFGAEFADALWARARRRRLRGADVVATATAFTAASIADAYHRFGPGRIDQVIVCGGGARNPALVGMLQDRLGSATVIPSDDLGISADAKEAVSFAVLAAETIRGRPGNVPAATGAGRAVVLGKIVPASP